MQVPAAFIDRLDLVPDVDKDQLNILVHGSAAAKGLKVLPACAVCRPVFHTLFSPLFSIFCSSLFSTLFSRLTLLSTLCFTLFSALISVSLFITLLLVALPA